MLLISSLLGFLALHFSNIFHGKHLVFHFFAFAVLYKE